MENSYNAVMVREFGDPKNHKIETLDFKPLGPDEVRVKIMAVGISYVDVLVAQGKYQLKPPLPFIPGSEFAGIITEVGENISKNRIGERVMGSGFGLAMAQFAQLDAKSVYKIPDNMSFAEASVFRVSYITVYYALKTRANLQKNEIVLVMGAAGAIGIAAIQIAKAMGAKIIASCSSQVKRDLAIAAGADWATDANAENWRDLIKEITNGKGANVIIDPLGDSATERAFRSIAWNGRHLIIGFAQGEIPKIATNLPLLKGAAIIGVDIRQFGIFEPEAMQTLLAELMEIAKSGTLKPQIAQIFKFEDFQAAMEIAQSGKIAGRIVISTE